LLVLLLVPVVCSEAKAARLLRDCSGEEEVEREGGRELRSGGMVV
jgi:hypothetical protein